MRSVKTVTTLVVSFVLVLALASSARSDVLGYWNFNEDGTGQTINAGGALLDSSGNQRHMRVAGGDVTTVAGAAGGTAIQFTSTSRGEFAPGNDFGGGLVASALDFNFGATDSFTVEIEAKLTGNGALFGKGFNGGSNPQWYMWGWSGPQLFAWVNSDATNYGYANSNPAPFTFDTWHRFALVRDKTAGTISSYVDGVLAATGSDASLDTSTTGNFSINTQNSGGQYYSSNPVMDYVRVSNVALSPSQFLMSDVPEPSTLMLLVSALAGLLAYAWRKRR